MKGCQTPKVFIVLIDNIFFEMASFPEVAEGSLSY